ncbi:Y-family DNA polymerase [Candidatus Dojkabacteria bacterium]|uniref:Y-family DNA polymerase n=1 Tax=Candidatus Dojkabacteria bacterium TaxID=2099670 RepID=A0A3M0YYX6_9BACT|nr:MAG: Y-family DNA polymerase [Candidatus Dojkabacteria bacterium]
MKSIFVLVDCNNFFAACEQCFDLSLKNKPVIVLSNNDGCVVSRSVKAKQIGIPMGVPFFKIRNQVIKYDVKVFSSNYQLYGDMSKRVMSLIKERFNKVEIYSIDEAFIDLTNSLECKDHKEELKSLRNYILKCTGITVSIGIAQTKVLSKIANEIAKKDPEYEGVCDLNRSSDSDLNRLLKLVKIEDVWGIGKNYANWFKQYGVYNALDLKNFDKTFVKRKFGVVGERLILELNGISCLKLNENVEPKKRIVSSRSFPKEITKFEDIENAVSYHCSNVAEKLRRQNSVARMIGVFLIKNRFKEYTETITSSHEILNTQTSYTPELCSVCLKLLKKIFKPGNLYKKCGVFASEITREDNTQYHLFENFDSKIKIKQKSLMQKFDLINKKWGKGSIKLGSEGFEKNWRMSQNYLSKRYTTNWDELPVVR